MSEAKYSQKEAVIYATLEVLSQRGVEYVLGESESVLDILTYEDKDNIKALMVKWFDEKVWCFIGDSRDDIKGYVSGLVRNHHRKSSELNAGVTYNSSEYKEIESERKKKLLGEDRYNEMQTIQMNLEIEKFNNFVKSDPENNIFKPERELIYNLSSWESLQEFQGNYYSLKFSLDRWQERGIEVAHYLSAVGDMIELIERRMKEIDRQDMLEDQAKERALNAIEELKWEQRESRKQAREIADEANANSTSLIRKQEESNRIQAESNTILSSTNKKIGELNERHRVAFWNNGDYVIKKVG